MADTENKWVGEWRVAPLLCLAIKTCVCVRVHGHQARMRPAKPSAAPTRSGGGGGGGGGTGGGGRRIAEALVEPAADGKITSRVCHAGCHVWRSGECDFRPGLTMQAHLSIIHGC